MKNLTRIIELMFTWLFSVNVSLRIKLLYLAYLPATLFNLIIYGRKSIYYLCPNFIFDDLSDLFTTLEYPASIKKCFLDFIDSNEIKEIVDIGSNLGQFSVTISHLLKHQASIYSFEPNKDIFPILRQNVSSYKNIHPYNFGVGHKSKSTLYFTKYKSAKGSLIKNNAQIAGNNNLICQEVDLINNIDNLIGKSYYDLIKIDVEGAELEIIENLGDLKCKYLLIEIACRSRVKDYNHSELFKAIRAKFGEYNILYQSQIKKDSECFDCLFSFS